jgi:hypothetical protein
VADVPQELIERAILREALRGATRTELWLAVRIASTFATEEQFRSALAQLVVDGHVDEAPGQWTTTRAGRKRLELLRGAA